MSFRMRWKYYYLTIYVISGCFSMVFLCEIVYPLLLRKSDVVFVQHEGQKANTSPKRDQISIIS